MFRHCKGGRLSAKCTGCLYPRRNPWYSLSEAESTSGHMVLSGEPRKNSPVTPPGIDPGTVRLVATPGLAQNYNFLQKLIQNLNLQIQHKKRKTNQGKKKDDLHILQPTNKENHKPIQIAVYTVSRYSWWWTVDLSETRRALYQINLTNCASRWRLL